MRKAESLITAYGYPSAFLLILLFAFPQPTEAVAQADPCPIKPEMRLVRGKSLTPLISEGQTITLLRGYYQCHPVQRGDVVAYRYAGNPAPLLKVVKAVAGDVFSLQSNSKGQGWHLLINNEVARNSQGIPYIIDEHGHRMLMLYVRNAHGRIPARACLLLGNQPDGSLDSTHFGLAGQDDILGKVMLK